MNGQAPGNKVSKVSKVFKVSKVGRCWARGTIEDNCENTIRQLASFCAAQGAPLETLATLMTLATLFASADLKDPAPDFNFK